MNIKKILLTTFTFILLTASAFASTNYPSLGNQYFPIGNNDLYVVEININDEYLFNKNTPHIIETTISLSLNNKGRQTIFQAPGQDNERYRQNAQFVVMRLRYELYPDRCIFQRLSYQVLDSNKNVMHENMKPTKSESIDHESAAGWWSDLIIAKMEQQFKSDLTHIDDNGKLYFDDYN